VSAWILGGLLLLAGCGPGLGGTGTGDAAFAAFGAASTPVCGGAVAAALACPSAPATPSGSSVGTLPVQFADAAGQIVLELNGNVAQFDDACLRLHFSGEFGTTNGGAQGFFGSYQIAATGIDVLAALTAVTAPGGGLTVELQDVGGVAIVGPLLLQRATVPLAGPNSC
jgi:hypothetical protein